MKTTRGDGSILVGVDGSEGSLAALDWAIDQACLTGNELVAVITWEIPTSYGWANPWPDDVDFEGDARAVLEMALKKELGDGRSPRLRSEVVQGHPSVVLAERSREASLLVVGSRGHGEFAGMLLGSVSQHLATHAHCPVVIVRGPKEGAERS